MQASLGTTLRRMLTPWRLIMAPCKLITVLWRLTMVKRGSSCHCGLTMAAITTDLASQIPLWQKVR